jgi:hypothetical protein
MKEEDIWRGNTYKVLHAPEHVHIALRAHVRHRHPRHVMTAMATMSAVVLHHVFRMHVVVYRRARRLLLLIKVVEC